ncbi:MAG: bifunctional riboflavin kinase/FAD synthetase, partial [Thermodesulfovibrionales bacterium]|nr:bifunctional riboflavin kinase/FAD synthetase [Thermodesulfovibrionales bacterium]
SGKYGDVVLTIGNFDGIHLGHQKILSRVVSGAKEIQGMSMAVTFDPHPTKVLYPERNIRILTPADEKARLMAHFGLDALCFINFTKGFASVHPDDFIRDVLVGKIGVREVIVGHRYAFGRGKKGTTELLRRRGRKYGFKVSVVRNARLYGDVVSSSRVRSLVGRGRVCEASLFLGRPYMISGTVIKGAGRGGRLLGTPTANISTQNELIPKEGVYAVKVRLGSRILGGVANIGKNPTFSSSGSSSGNGYNIMSYEVHIFDFSEDILSRPLMLYFIDRIRDEKAFPEPEALREQIKKDIARGREILLAKRHPALI